MVLLMPVRSVTPQGHRVALYWDSSRVKGQERDESIIAGLFCSHCVIPFVSPGALAPVADIFISSDANIMAPALVKSFELSGVPLLKGDESDEEDAVLKVYHVRGSGDVL